MFEREEKIAREIIPELNGRNLYVLARPEGFPVGVGTAAFAQDASYTSPALRKTLIESGDWNGPGAVICVVEKSLFNTELLIHELGHVLPLGDVAEDREPTAAEVETEQTMTRKWAELPPSERANDWRPWEFHHGKSFIRRALHLTWRARELRHEVWLAQVHIAGRYYGLSPACEYLKTLGDEPERFASKTFNEIEQTEPPKEFSSLFAADVAKWEAEYKQKKEKQNGNR